MRKRIYWTAVVVLGLGTALSIGGIKVNAVGTQNVVTEKTIYAGIHVGPVDIGGLTGKEAETAIKNYVDNAQNKAIALYVNGEKDGKQVVAKAHELGIYWANPEVIEEVQNLGKSGNIIERYKIKEDIEHSQMNYKIEFDVDEATLRAYLEAHKAEIEVEAKDATLTKTANGFAITDGEEGLIISVDESINALRTYLNEKWDGEDATFELSTQVSQPAVTREMCEKVTLNPMGSFTTSYTSSSTSRSKNIDNAVRLINGSVIMPGGQFSCLEHMVPFSEENGYYPAGSYLNGKLVDSLGGGVCQVSTTLYNAVLLAELDVVQRNNHGLTVSYVPLSADAAIAESSNMDLIFKNNTNAPIYIEGYTENKRVTFNIYGYDERPANRTIKYESVTVEVLGPGEDVVTIDSSLPAGTRYITQKSHTGYRAALYKYVYIDGKQTEKTQVNSSYYAPAPNYVTAAPEVVVEVETDPVTGETIAVNATIDPATGETIAVNPTDPATGETIAVNPTDPATGETIAVNPTDPATGETTIGNPMPDPSTQPSVETPETTTAPIEPESIEPETQPQQPTESIPVSIEQIEVPTETMSAEIAPETLQDAAVG